MKRGIARIVHGFHGNLQGLSLNMAWMLGEQLVGDFAGFVVGATFQIDLAQPDQRGFMGWLEFDHAKVIAVRIAPILFPLLHLSEQKP